MSFQPIIREKLGSGFLPDHLEILNESPNHTHFLGAGSEGPESHLKITMVTPKFDGSRPLSRHRNVQEVLKEEFAQVHSISLHLYTPDEWLKKSEAPDSPKCAGRG